MNELDKLYNMAEKYSHFSCKPKNKKYKIGTIFDEDKSVKWNREEVERKNKLHEEEVKKLNGEKNKIRDELIHNIKEYIKEQIGQKTKKNSVRADKIFAYLCDNHYDNGFKSIIDHLDELLEIFK